MPDRKPVSGNMNANPWASARRRIFRFEEGPPGAVWLPDQVFQVGFRFSFLFPYNYFRRPSYESIREAIALLGEPEFLVGPAGPDVQGSASPVTYPAEASYEAYLQHEDEPAFFLGTQPLNVYLHGQRTDWGIVASADYNIAVIGYRSAEAARAFTGRFIDDPGDLLQAYVPGTPDDVTPDWFRQRFVANYLSDLV